IFDNLEKPIPLPERGGIIVTTARRSGILKDHTLNQKDIAVEKFSLEQAKELFSKSVQKEKLKEFEKLFKKLDGNPFYLNQARVAITRNPKATVETYLNSLTPDNHPMFDEVSDSPYESRIAEECIYTLDQLKAENSQ